MSYNRILSLLDVLNKGVVEVDVCHSVLDNVFEDSEVLFDARVGTFFFHGWDVLGLEINDTFFVTGLVDLVEELGSGEETVGLFGGDWFHLYLINNYWTI